MQRVISAVLERTDGDQSLGDFEFRPGASGNDALYAQETVELPSGARFEIDAAWAKGNKNLSLTVRSHDGVNGLYAAGHWDSVDPYYRLLVAGEGRLSLYCRRIE
jgi:hypothetical protein